MSKEKLKHIGWYCPKCKSLAQNYVGDLDKEASVCQCTFPHSKIRVTTLNKWKKAYIKE